MSAALTRPFQTDKVSYMEPTVFQKFFLGIVQGLTEFLPISSSAHLILVPSYFHWTDPGLAFDVALHLGTLLGVVVYFWRDLVRIQRRLVGQLLLATIPGAIAGLLLEHKAETVFRDPLLIGLTLISMGLALLIADWFLGGMKTLDDMSAGAALALGVAQSAALIPGVSRSGVTITLALALGFRRTEAARFSFLMSIPVIAGAGLLKFHEILGAPDKLGLSVGFVAAAVSGFFAIWVLLRYVQNHRYTPFVLYRWALGAYVLTHLSLFK